jgi:hypothetical protein
MSVELIELQQRSSPAENKEFAGCFPEADGVFLLTPETEVEIWVEPVASSDSDGRTKEEDDEFD